MTDSLDAFGLSLTYQHRNMSGMAMDGQYTHLNVKDHVSDILGKSINLSWDPAHKIELAVKDSDDTFVSKTTSIIQTVMTNLNYGKNFEILLENKALGEIFLVPRVFKTMKFIGHCSGVFKAFETDFKSIIATLEKTEDFASRDKILSLDFVTDFLFLTDVNNHLSFCSKSVQKSNNLPWDYTDSVSTLLNAIDSMIDELKKCEKDLSENKLYKLNSLVFSKLHTYDKVLLKREFQGIVIPEIPVSSIRTRSITKYLRNTKKPDNQEVEQSLNVYNFMSDRVVVYKDYLEKLSENIKSRFSS